MSNGDPIIIKGGNSIEIILHKDSFPTDSSRPERHFSVDRKIRRVEIIDNNTNQSRDCTIPANGKCTIKIHHSK